MRAWLESVAGPEYASALMWTVVALVALLVVLIIVRIVRGLTFGTFVAGGRNRKTRLAVMDATAVDSQRRLVLVRRDDVEHLILIGGPTDVVVEQNIRLLPPARRPAAPEAPAERQQPAPAGSAPAASGPPKAPAAPARSAAQYQPAARSVYVPPSPPAAPPRPSEPAAYARRASDVPASSAPPVSAPAPSFVKPASEQRPAAATAPLTPRTEPGFGSYTPRPAASQPTPPKTEPDKHDLDKQDIDRHDLDEALLEELEVTLDRTNPTSTAPTGKENSVDDEMSRLLGELSNEKR